MRGLIWQIKTGKNCPRAHKGKPTIHRAILHKQLVLIALVFLSSTPGKKKDLQSSRLTCRAAALNSEAAVFSIKIICPKFETADDDAPVVVSSCV